MHLGLETVRELAQVVQGEREQQPAAGYFRIQAADTGQSINHPGTRFEQCFSCCRDVEPMIGKRVPPWAVVRPRLGLAPVIADVKFDRCHDLTPNDLWHRQVCDDA